MTQPDLKTLITGFLILAIIVSSAAFIFSGFGSYNSTKSSSSAGPADQAAQTAENRVAQISKNAFAEPLPNDLPTIPQQGETIIQNTSADSIIAPAASDNLTDNFVKETVNQIIANNPEGPQTTGDGGQILNLPTEEYASNLIVKTIIDNNFDINEKALNKELKILADYTPEDIVKYLQSVSSTLTNTVLSPRFTNLLNQEPNLDMANAGYLVFDQAINETASIPVPQPLVPLHKSILSFLMNQRKIYEAVGGYQADPLKGLVALRNVEQIINRDIANLQAETQKINFGKQSFNLNSRGYSLSFFKKFFGINQARAQLFVPTWELMPANVAARATTAASTSGSLLKRIAEWVLQHFVRVLANRLINQFQNQVVNWIAGGGKPKFVTNWKGFLSDAFNQAAGAAIQKMAPGFCSSFGPILQVALKPVPNIYDQTRCTLGDIERNVTNFYNSFQNGGWVAYGNTLKPGGNFFGTLIEAHDIALGEAAAAAEARKQEAVASQGFTGVKRCTKTDPPGFEGAAGLNKVGDIIERGGGNGKISALVECVQDETQTPGSTVASALHTSMTWKGEQIVSAQRFEDLVAAIIDASINRIIGLGLKAATKALSGGSSSGGAPSTSGAVYQELNTSYPPSSVVTGAEGTPEASVGEGIDAITNQVINLNLENAFRSSTLPIILPTSTEETSTTP